MKWLAPALLLGVLVAAQPAGAAIPTRQEYARAVHEIRRTLDQPDISMVALSRVEHAMRSLARVRVGGGVLRTAMPVLAAELGNGRHTADVRAQVDALDHGLRTLPQRAPRSVDLRALDSVLRESRFHPSCAPLDCLGQWLGGLLPHFAGRNGLPLPDLPPIAGWIIAIVFLLMVLALGVVLVRGALEHVVVTVRPRESLAAVAIASRARAEELAAQGAFRPALHFLFLATLLTLFRRNGLDVPPGQTNRELLRAAENAVTLQDLEQREALRDLVDRFDRAWYGHVPFGADDFAVCRRLAQRILDDVDQGAA